MTNSETLGAGANSLTPFQRGVLRRITIAIMLFTLLASATSVWLVVHRTDDVEEFDAMYARLAAHAATCPNPRLHVMLFTRKWSLPAPPELIINEVRQVEFWAIRQHHRSEDSTRL